MVVSDLFAAPECRAGREQVLYVFGLRVNGATPAGGHR